MSIVSGSSMADVGLLLAKDRYGLIGDADRRFRKVLLRFGLPMLLFAIAVPWLHFELPAPELKLPEPTPRRVELLPEPVIKPAQIEPKLQPVRPKTEPQKPLPKAAAAPAASAAAAPKPDARQQAAAAGLMQMREQLAALNDRSLVAVDSQQALITGAKTSSGSSPVLTAAASSSGAGGTAARGVAGQGTAGDLGARRTGQVQPGPTGRGSAAGSGTSGLGATGRGGRGLEDIQLGFDRSKSSLNAIFGRAARETVGMGAGRIVVSLSIAPDGSVSRCELVSSSFANPALEQKLLARIRQMNFGAKDVPMFSYPNYPIDFLPT
ncbi:AgmX/PglI C-terminal domain-containing protein [Nevskia ramosa]|uniref:AgmX/PglI C-terminal domain-containing protein n=1 Tax=Nevskia ramosa TaxID=64002 RepID=UPI003D0AB135